MDSDKQTFERTDLASLALVRRWCQDGTARKIRVDSRLSLADIAAVVQVSPVSVSRWERGLLVPRGEPAWRYTGVLWLLRQELLGGVR